MTRFNPNPNRIHFVFTVSDAEVAFISDAGTSGTVKLKGQSANDKISEITNRFKDHYDVVSFDLVDQK